MDWVLVMLIGCFKMLLLFLLPLTRKRVSSLPPFLFTKPVQGSLCSWGNGECRCCVSAPYLQAFSQAPGLQDPCSVSTLGGDAGTGGLVWCCGTHTVLMGLHVGTLQGPRVALSVKVQFCWFFLAAFCFQGPGYSLVWVALTVFSFALEADSDCQCSSDTTQWLMAC